MTQPAFTTVTQAILLTISIVVVLSANAAEGYKDETAKISLGNGEKNWILVTGTTRDDSVLTFPEVNIQDNGWLVIHPFENGKPNGDKYIAATFLEAGKNMDVKIKVHKGITPNEQFIVMLHRDSNHNGIFDFVFIDDKNVMDRALFEGNTMIAHIISAP